MFQNKTKHIGILACSAEGAALCYRTLCAEGKAFMGEHMHPEITMHTYPLGKYMHPIEFGQWDKVAEIMLASADKLALAGADFFVCPDNTIHEAADWLRDNSPMPWIHIAEAVAEEAQSRSLRNLAVLGTKYLMAGPVYPSILRRFGIACLTPDESTREIINTMIFHELVYGVIKEETRDFFLETIEDLKNRGCDGVVLGCTEIPLLIAPDQSPLPTLDSTRLLARAALNLAVRGY